MPPRFGMEPPVPPAPAKPNPFVVPTAVPGQQQSGPVFGGQPSTAPLVGVGRPSVATGRRLEDGGGLLPPGMQSRSPRRVVEGFDTQPADVVLQSIFDIPKAELRALQTQMYDAGFYGNVSKEAVVFGAVDDATYGAFGDLLEMTGQYVAAGREVTWYELLDEVHRLRKEQGTNLLANQGPKRAPFVAQTTAPEDVERVAQHVATQLTGQSVDPGLVKQIVADFRAREVGSQRAVYDAAETGGTVTDAPAVETFAAEAVEEADPLGTQAYAVADRVMADFTSIIQGPFGG